MRTSQRNGLLGALRAANMRNKELIQEKTQNPQSLASEFLEINGNPPFLASEFLELDENQPFLASEFLELDGNPPFLASEFQIGRAHV